MRLLFHYISHFPTAATNVLQQMFEVQISTAPAFANTPHLQQLKLTSYARCLLWHRHACRLLAVVERAVMADNSTARVTTMTMMMTQLC